MFKSMIRRSSTSSSSGSSSTTTIVSCTRNIKIIVVLIIQSFVVTSRYLRDIPFHEQQHRQQTEEVMTIPTTTKVTITTPRIKSSNSDNEQLQRWRGQYDTDNLTHPFLGAYRNHDNDKGNNSSSVAEAGWIVNPSIDRLQEVNFDDKYILTQDYVCNATLIPSSQQSHRRQKNHSDSGIEGDGGHKVLMKVQRGLDKARKQLSHESTTLTSNSSSKNNSANSSKILCMIYTYHSNKDGHTNLEAIADTWGRRCDGFIGFSNFTDHSVGAINIAHAGPESYNNMWQKVRSIWTYVYQHYINEYDYFYIAGDDVYIAVENLRVYLDGRDVQRYYYNKNENENDNNGTSRPYFDRISSHPNHINKARKAVSASAAVAVVAASQHRSRRYGRPLLFGAPMMSRWIPVIAGGPGYVLNAAALDIFGTKGGTNMYETDTYDSKEDWLIGHYFANNGIFISDTTDGKDGIRFGYGAQFISQFNGIRSPTRPKQLHALYGLGIKSQLDSISEQQISFHIKDELNFYNKNNENHYTISQLMIRYHAILYYWCK